jgi:hypothetical protein
MGDQPAPVPVAEPPVESDSAPDTESAGEESQELSDASAEALKRVRARRGKKKGGGK